MGTPGRRPGVPRLARGFRDWFLHPDRPRGFRDWFLRGWRDPNCGLRVWPLKHMILAYEEFQAGHREGSGVAKFDAGTPQRDRGMCCF